MPDTLPFSTRTLADGTLCVSLQGRLDTVAVEALEPALRDAVAAADAHAVFDLAGASFLSSMGVRLLISSAKAQRARGRRLVLCAPQPAVRTTLDIVALDQIIPVLADLEAAQGALAA